MDAARARELFTYDGRRGCLLWRETDVPVREYVHSKGYRTCSIGRERPFVHRLVWMVLFGDLMSGEQIDHINGDRADNRPENLRKADNSTNQMNARVRSDNLLGVKGVYRRLDKQGRVRFRAKIWKGRRCIASAERRTLEEAVAWRVAKVHDLHGEFARTA